MLGAGDVWGGLVGWRDGGADVGGGWLLGGFYFCCFWEEGLAMPPGLGILDWWEGVMMLIGKEKLGLGSRCCDMVLGDFGDLIDERADGDATASFCGWATKALWSSFLVELI